MRTAATEAQADAAARAAAAGDAIAFETLCSLVQGDIWRYCQALVGDPDLAREAAQETFVRAVTAIRTFRGECPARVFLLVLARRSCAAMLQREARQPVTLPLDARFEPVSPGYGGTVEMGLLLAALPDDLRQAFVLTQVLGLSYDEAARVAECPVGTIRSRIYRARERLVAAMSHEDSEVVADDGSAGV